MPKLLFICSSLNTGGAQRVLSNILIYLPREWEFDILLNDSSSITYPYQGNLIDLGIKTATDKNSLFYQGRAFFLRWNKVTQLKKQKHYDYVVSFLESANILNIITKTKESQSILTSHNVLSYSIKNDRKYRFIVKPLAKTLYNKADKIIVVSEGVKEDFIKNFGINRNLIQTIYNGIDLDYIQHTVDSMPCKKDKSFKVCTMGRLVKQKGQWHLIRAVKALIDKKYDIQLHIYGEGPLEKYLKNLAGKYQIMNSVFFEGFVNPPFPSIAECDLFVFPSLHEGFGNTLIEAAACNVPSIASDYESGAREILAPGTDAPKKTLATIELGEYGILVPVCSDIYYNYDQPLEKEEWLLANAIELMMTNKELYAEYQGKCQQLASRFSMQKIKEEWIHLFSQKET